MANWEHNSLGARTGAPQVAGHPFAYAWERDGTQHIVYRANDGQINEIWYRDQWLGEDWHHNPIGQIAGGPKAASDPMGYAWEKDKTQHVIYRATDNDIYELWCRKGKWGKSNLSNLTGAPKAAGNPFGYAWEKDKSQHIVYRGQDNQIHEIWYRDQWGSNDWDHNPIGQKVGAPKAASDPMGYAWERDGTQHVIYRGVDDQIHEIWGRRGKWGYNSIGDLTGAPPAVGKPTGYAWEKDGTQHIIYRSANGHLNEIWYRDAWVGEDWHYKDMTAEANARIADSDPFGYSWEKDKTQHVIYRGQDNLIYELWYREKAWQSNPIGRAVSAPLGVGNPIGYSWERDSTQHVIYKGSDGQIHELFSKQDGLLSGLADVGTQAVQRGLGGLFGS
jgi:uncharacterized protein with PIN domain